MVIQMAMANIKVGQKLNGSMMIKLFGFISAKTVVDLVRVRFLEATSQSHLPERFPFSMGWRYLAQRSHSMYPHGGVYRF